MKPFLALPLILAVLVLLPGCALVSKQTKGDTYSVGLLGDLGHEDEPRYFFAIYDGTNSGKFQVVRLWSGKVKKPCEDD